jgi:hypothetical protein
VRRPQVGAAGFFLGRHPNLPIVKMLSSYLPIFKMLSTYLPIFKLSSSYLPIVRMSTSQFTYCQNVNFPIYRLSKCRLPNLPTVKMSTS